MTSEVWKILSSRLYLGFDSNPRDGLDYYTRNWEASTAGTIMPPSPGVKDLRYEVMYKDSRLSYHIRAKWRDITKWLAEKLDSEQKSHRSRVGTIAFRPLQVRENQKKLRNVATWINDDVFSGIKLTDSQSYAMYDLMMDETIKALEYDIDHIRHFVSEHETSSMTPGIRWSNLASMPSEDWRSFFDSIANIAERARSNPGRWLNITYHDGLRARSDAFKQFPNSFKGNLDRTRIVMFHPTVSSWNIFLPNKKNLYKRVLEQAMSMLGLSHEVHFPYVEGGQVFKTISDLFSEGKKFSGYDGKNWEGSVGTLLGPAFRPFYQYLSGVAVLPSGIWATSLLGTLASLLVLKKQSTRVQAVIQGDDQNLFGRSVDPKLPFVELSKEDTRAEWVLGFSYKTDPLKPRITGLKVQSDRSDKALPLRLKDGFSEGVMLGQHQDDSVLSWIGAYLGSFGGKTLVEAVRSVDFNKLDVVSPTTVTEELIKPQSEGFRNHSWIEEYGLRKSEVLKSV